MASATESLIRPDRGTWSKSQLRVTMKCGCMRNGRILEPNELPRTVLETLRLVCQGYSNTEIADMRHYSHSAIVKHVTALLVVFNARSRTHLAALAVLLRIVP